MTKLMHNLCIELGIIYDRIIVYICPCWDVKTEVTTASRRVAKRMLIVGGCQERSIPWAVFLAFAEDRSAIDLHFGENLFELALLARSHVGELVDVDIEVVCECHFCVKLVAEVDVVEEVHAESFGQESYGEGTLAATLLSDEYRHRLVAMEHVHLEPVGNG